MLNVLIALGMGVATLVAVGVTLGWIAGLLPAVIVFAAAFLLLSRRTGALVQAEMEAVVPLLQAQKVDEARAKLVAIREKYGRWQLMLSAAVDAQLGMMAYIQQKFDEAMPLLERGKWRNWGALTCIACVHWRRGEKDKAFEHLEKAEAAGPKESIVWVIHARLLLQAERRDDALKVLAQGLAENKDSELLKDIQQTIANKRKIETSQLPQTWYQFFPEDLQKEMLLQRGRRDGSPVLPFKPPAAGEPAKLNRAQRRAQEKDRR